MREDIDIDGTSTVSAIITRLIFSYRSLSAEQILQTIDLLLKHFQPDCPLDWSPAAWAPRIEEVTHDMEKFQDVRLDPFLGVAEYRNGALMQKVIELGLKPINEKEVYNWQGFARERNLTLTTALTLISTLTRNPGVDPAYLTIAFLVKYGAKPPENVLELIEGNKEISFEVKVALKQLFNLPTLFSPETDAHALQLPEEPHFH